LELARSHNNLGNLLRDLGKRAEAETAYRHAAVIQEKLAADFPAVPQYRLELAGSHNNVGILLADLGKRSEAEVAYRRALAIQEKLSADFPAVPQYRLELAKSHNCLGDLLGDLGKRAEAEAAYRRALAIHEKLVADFPTLPPYRQELARSHNNVGALLAQRGKRPEAETAFRRALAIQERLTSDFPTVPQYRLELAGSHSNLGSLLRDLAKYPEAEVALRQALAIQEKLTADFPAVPEYRLDLGSSQVNIGDLHQSNQQPEQALQWYSQGIETLDNVLRQVGVDATAQHLLRNAHAGRAQVLESLKRHAEAAKDWDKALELSPEPERAAVRMDRALSLVRAGQVDTALQEAEELAKNADAKTLYSAACVFALAAAGSSAKEDRARRAVALLRQAVAKGYKDAEHMKKDDDLKTLRQRDDFKELLAEMDKAR
jgi:tetratricopeptide (TPR) repeat protein